MGRFTYLLIALLLVPGLVRAVEAPRKVHWQVTADRDLDPVGRGRTVPSRVDTVWFGGLGTDGLAAEDGVWDFDTAPLGADGFQGWTSIDRTTSVGIYLGRVTAADFTADPYVPMLSPVPPATENIGQLWCGIHEAEAIERGFVAGMGYGNRMCQRALSPAYAYSGGQIDIRFDYFHHSEPGYDYSYVYVVCFDEDDGEIDQYLVDFMDGVSPGGDSSGAYNWEHPQSYLGTVGAGDLDPVTVKIQIELRFRSDGGWSDEDGDWATPAGPLGADNIEIEIGGALAGSYDFEADDGGWSPAPCVGQDAGSYMGIVSESVFLEWIEESGLLCGCGIGDHALEFIDEDASPFYPPGHPIGQYEMAVSNIIYRSPAYASPTNNTTTVFWDQFSFMEYGAGVRYRIGYQYYPFTSVVNPEPHWSDRRGQDPWFYVSGGPSCAGDDHCFNTLNGQAGTPLPADWDSLRVTYEIICSCAEFGVPPTTCAAPPPEGHTYGSPVIDNVRVALTGRADAPAIAFGMSGGEFHDGFGQNFPTYVEPGDVGDANHGWDLSGNDPDENDWYADTVVVTGPVVPEGNPAARWLCQLNVKVARKGPRQDFLQGYHEWKARLAGDPEAGFVAALMDSAEVCVGGCWIGWPNKFSTHFHEDDPGFDPGWPDLAQEQEIVPDKIWSPGTRIEYYYTGCWYDNYPHPEPEQIFRYPTSGVWDFEILPGMEANTATPEDYDVVWPSVLYIDAYNRGVEYYIRSLLDHLGIVYDQFDYLYAAACWNAPMARSYGGSYYNPGGYGNTGCTLEQLLGYRLILLSSGSFGAGALEEEDYDMFAAWLEDTAHGTDYRRAFIFDGDGAATIIESANPYWASDVLGVAVADDGTSYREYNNDWTPCVELTPSAGHEFAITDPGVRLYGSGCTQTFDYNVLQALNLPGVTGNLDYYNYTNNPNAYDTYVSYAQVLRENIEPQAANWKTVVNGFSLHHLSAIGCVADEDCSSDSACVVSGAAAVLEPALAWILEGAQPLAPWSRTLPPNSPEDPRPHLSGPVNYLHAGRPNPFRSSARIEFSLAATGQITLSIYDVSGRLVRTLADGVWDAGSHALEWDGTDERGSRAGAGIYWMKLATHDGYRSGMRLLTLR